MNRLSRRLLSDEIPRFGRGVHQRDDDEISEGDGTIGERTAAERRASSAQGENRRHEGKNHRHCGSKKRRSQGEASPRIAPAKRIQFHNDNSYSSHNH